MAESGAPCIREYLVLGWRHRDGQHLTLNLPKDIGESLRKEVVRMEARPSQGVRERAVRPNAELASMR